MCFGITARPVLIGKDVLNQSNSLISTSAPYRTPLWLKDNGTWECYFILSALSCFSCSQLVCWDFRKSSLSGSTNGQKHILICFGNEINTKKPHREIVQRPLLGRLFFAGHSLFQSCFYPSIPAGGTVRHLSQVLFTPLMSNQPAAYSANKSKVPTTAGKDISKFSKTEIAGTPSQHLF